MSNDSTRESVVPRRLAGRSVASSISWWFLARGSLEIRCSVESRSQRNVHLLRNYPQWQQCLGCGFMPDPNA